jgi:hypothetical protein
MHDSLNGGVLTNWLAIVGVISLFYWAWRIVVTVRAKSGQTPPVSRLSVPESAALPLKDSGRPGLPPPEDIVAIAAAVYTVLGAHRIVRLEPLGPSATWAVEGRLMQQSSHTPR